MLTAEMSGQPLLLYPLCLLLVLAGLSVAYLFGWLLDRVLPLVGSRSEDSVTVVFLRTLSGLVLGVVVFAEVRSLGTSTLGFSLVIGLVMAWQAGWRRQTVAPALWQREGFAFAAAAAALTVLFYFLVLAGMPGFDLYWYPGTVDEHHYRQAALTMLADGVENRHGALRELGVPTTSQTTFHYFDVWLYAITMLVPGHPYILFPFVLKPLCLVLVLLGLLSLVPPRARWWVLPLLPLLCIPAFFFPKGPLKRLLMADETANGLLYTFLVTPIAWIRHALTTAALIVIIRQLLQSRYVMACLLLLLLGWFNATLLPSAVVMCVLLVGYATWQRFPAGLGRTQVLSVLATALLSFVALRTVYHDTCPRLGGCMDVQGGYQPVDEPFIGWLSLEQLPGVLLIALGGFVLLMALWARRQEAAWRRTVGIVGSWCLVGLGGWCAALILQVTEAHQFFVNGMMPAMCIGLACVAGSLLPLRRKTVVTVVGFLFFGHLYLLLNLYSPFIGVLGKRVSAADRFRQYDPAFVQMVRERLAADSSPVLGLSIPFDQPPYDQDFASPFTNHYMLFQTSTHVAATAPRHYWLQVNFPMRLAGLPPVVAQAGEVNYLRRLWVQSPQVLHDSLASWIGRGRMKYVVATNAAAIGPHLQPFVQETWTDAPTGEVLVRLGLPGHP